MIPTTTLLIDLFIKATIVLAAAHAISFALRRRSAGTRHLVLSSALIALLALPFTTPMLGIVELPVLPAESNSESPVRAELLSIRPAAPASAAEASGETWGESAAVGALSRNDSDAPVTRADEETSAGVTVPLISMNSIRSWIVATVTPPTVILAIWLIGAAFLLVHLATGVLRVQWIVERALPLRDRTTLDLVDEASSQIGLERHPDVLISQDLSVPVVWGLTNPSLLLPIESEDWSEDRRRAVLLHELAHVERRDGLTLILTRIALAIYWVNPLAWIAAKMARRYCERACDDVVLARGTRASDYADHLLAIARTLPDSEQLATVTLAMSRRSEIEGRLMAILHPDLRRATITRRGAFAAAVIAAVAVITVSSFRLTAEETDRQPDESMRAVEHSSSEPDLEVTIEAEGDVEQQEWNDNPNWNTNSNTNWNVNSSSSSSSRSESRLQIAEGQRSGKKLKKHAGTQSEGAKIWEAAWNAHQNDRFDESIPLFMKTAELGYRAESSLYNVACGYAMQGNVEDAVRWLERAVESGFDDWKLLREDSDLDPVRTSNRFRSFIESVPADLKRRSERSRDRTERAIERLRELERKASTDASEWAETGRHLLGLRIFDESEVALRSAIRFADSPPVISMYNMACLEALRGNDREAIAWLDKAIDSGLDRTEKIANDPDLASLRGTPSFDAIVKKSKMLSLDRFTTEMRGDEPLDRRRERWSPAIAQFVRYTSARPESGRAWWNLGWAQHMSGMYAAAIDSFERAETLNYRPANAAFNIACGHARLGHHDLARQWLARAADRGFDLGDRLHWDEDLASLRGDARIEAMFERHKD